MNIQDPIRLYEIFKASTSLYNNKENIKVVTEFMEPLAFLYEASDWALLFNDYTKNEIDFIHHSGAYSCDKSIVFDVLPVFFQSDEMKNLSSEQVSLIFNSLTPAKAAPEMLAGHYSSFMLSDHESVVLVFFYKLDSLGSQGKDIEEYSDLNSFIRLFVRSNFLDSKELNLHEQLSVQVRRLNTWIEGLSWINQAKVDETQEYSSKHFYEQALFQLKIIVQADLVFIVSADKFEVLSVAGYESEGGAEEYGLAAREIVKDINIERQGTYEVKCQLHSGDNVELESVILLPIFVGDDLASIIFLNKVSQSFERDDRVIARLFSDGVEKIVERRCFLSSLKRRNDQLNKTREEQENLISQLREAKDQIIQNEKMASIGQLAAGVAHEINNPIGYVNANLKSLSDYINDTFDLLESYEKLESLVDTSALQLAEVLRVKKEIDIDFIKEDAESLVAESNEGIERVKKIVADLKYFSHVDKEGFQKVDIHEGLESSLNIASNELKYKAEIKREYSKLPEIECAPSKLNQVYLNLLVNAAHAIESDGIVTIATQKLDDNFITIKVSDNGKGIDKDNLTKIFDPFFTTKPVGSGTGLGLSLSYGIIKKHSGKLSVESEVGKGTTFTIKLPIVQECSDV